MDKDTSVENCTQELDGGAIEPSPDTMLDAADRAILNLIQTAFPLEARPYLVIGKAVGTTEDEAFARVCNLKERKIIRRLGANFVSGKLGFRSTLCAAKVPKDTLESFIAVVNCLPGVTHNYLRSHAYNVWFTLIGPSWEEVCAEIEALTRKTGIEILNLPATRLYKVKVDFNME